MHYPPYERPQKKTLAHYTKFFLSFSVTLEYSDEPNGCVKFQFHSSVKLSETLKFSLRSEEFVIFPRELRNQIPKLLNEDQLLIIEHVQRTRSDIKLANRIWCLRRLVLRNSSPYSVDVLMTVSEGDFFFFQEDILAKRPRGNRIIRPLDKSKAEESVISKTRITISSNQSNMVSFIFSRIH